MSDPVAPGRLFVVATPIGNLGDLTLRAARVLREAAWVASEDTRRTRNLLNHLGIKARLVSYYRGKERDRGGAIIERLLAGESVALVSDAGTPGIADPGTILVRMAREAGIPVEPVPGPSALAAALSVCGIDATPFHFVGFLPSRAAQRRKALDGLRFLEAAIVFYEAPHRIAASLADCLEVLGDRPAFLGRELTKLHEETRLGMLSELAADIGGRDSVKGEFVIILEGKNVSAGAGRSLDEALLWHRDQARSTLRDAVREVVAESGRPKSEVYARALELWNGSDRRTVS